MGVHLYFFRRIVWGAGQNAGGRFVIAAQGVEPKRIYGEPYKVARVDEDRSHPHSYRVQFFFFLFVFFSQCIFFCTYNSGYIYMKNRF